MVDFAFPWVFLGLPLPWLVRRVVGQSFADGALIVPVGMLPARAADLPYAGRLTKRLRFLLEWAAWLLLLVAAARPLGSEPLPTAPADGGSYFIAVDLSSSMAVEDVAQSGHALSRMDAARRLARELLARRQGGRVGLIIFGRQAYVFVPLTYDRQAVQAALDEAEVGLSGAETAIGDAVGLAVNRLREMPATDRVLVLLTDGASNAGSLPPERAAWLAARESTRIHAVGVGKGAALDERVLGLLARETGGVYRRITEGDALSALARELDALATSPATVRAGLVKRSELYVWPLAGACLLAFLSWVAGRRLERSSA